MREIVFVTPTDERNIFRESVGPLLLATILQSKGIKSHILSFASFGSPADFAEFMETGVRRICEKEPKIVSFYTRSDCYHIMLKMAQLVKARLGCPIIFAGPQADIIARETLEEIPFVDFVCCGEGENTVYPFFSSLLRGEPDLSVDGLVYRKDGDIIMNPRPKLIEDLDTIPFVDYRICPEDEPANAQIGFPIDVGRGCPFGCTYCSTKTFWGRKYRLKSPARIVEEMQRNYDLYGARHFTFQHDMFTMNKALVKETCRLIKELPFKATWNCSARLDCIDGELIDVMADAGLYHIYLGIETGSPRMQKLINKNLKLEGVRERIAYLLSKNLQVTTSFIFGFPEETEEEVSQTFSLVTDLLRLGGVRVQMHRCAFLPGTAMYEEYKDRLEPAVGFSDMTGGVGVAECGDLFRDHPKLFTYFNEYTTELRTKLLHFPIFLNSLLSMRAVYLYLAEKYPRDRLIQMYFDFVEKNRGVLEQAELSRDEMVARIRENDLFVKSFTGDPCEPMIADAYRLRRARTAVSRGEMPTATEITCVSPLELDRGIPVNRCKAGWYMVTYYLDDKGAVKVQVRHT